jgi:hypothetical protein
MMVITKTDLPQGIERFKVSAQGRGIMKIAKRIEKITQDYDV